MSERKKYSAANARIQELTDQLRNEIDRHGGVTIAAEQLGISRATVSAWYNGQRTPDAEGLKTISEKFGVSVDYLYGKHSASAEDILLEQTGLTRNAFEKLVHIHNSATCWDAIISLLLEHENIITVLMLIDMSITFKRRGDDKEAERQLLSSVFELHDMLPDLAEEFLNRGIVTTGERQKNKLMREGGTDDGKH